MKTIRIILNFVLIALYAVLIFFVLSMFPFIPWHDAEGNYMLLFYIFWIPVCIISLIIVVLNLVNKRIHRLQTIALCFNAIFIPLVFVFGFAGVTWINYILGALLIASVVVYSAIFFKCIKDGTV